MKVFLHILKISHRIGLIMLGYFGLSIFDAIAFSLVVLCLLGVLTNTTLKFWHSGHQKVNSFYGEIETIEKFRIEFNWRYFRKGAFIIIWMITISILCYWVGYSFKTN